MKKSIKFFWWDIAYDEQRAMYFKEIDKMVIYFREVSAPWEYEAAIVVKTMVGTSWVMISAFSKVSLEDAISKLNIKVAEVFGQLSLVMM